jgi:hypothetical protein
MLMTEHKNRPARQEADMLELLLAERRRTAGKAKGGTSGKKKHERSDSKSDASRTRNEPPE